MKKDIYRSRIEKPLNKEILRFTSSIEDDLWIAEEDIIGTEVHNIMLFEQNLLSREEAKAILKSLEKLRNNLNSNQLKLDHEFEDIHPFIEKCVIDEIGIEIGGKLHTGRSRNDQIAVDTRLKIRAELNILSGSLFELIKDLFLLSKKTIKSYMPLYTHFQRAQLGTFAHYINNYIVQLIRSLERLEELYHRINRNPLGACAIGGTRIHINRNRTTELLGFEGIIENSIDAISSRDYIYETLMCLSLIAIQFSRIAEDLIIWSSDEFKYLELDEEVCSVSSVMPHKKNPDSLELIRSKTSKIISNTFSASLIIKSIPTGYFRDFQELKMLLKISFDTLFSIVIVFKNVFNTLKINETNMINAVNESYILSLDIAEYLVQELKIPFRISHHIVAKLVSDSKSPKSMLDKEKIENLIFELTNTKIKVPDNFTNQFENLELILENRKSKGSSSPSEIIKTINVLKQDKDKIEKKYLERLKLAERSKILREDSIQSLII